ncbi:hypothetical protein GGTG_01157 [Gaeumannomyces tritici R3-111a-1]|uniref:Uncharacterized protein n=1 Tax=Gaeumannomyces tritici (strain R3-111a-1) TaxID=644352 RepID=J3NIS3_GAET3|nr:hypothetical protein GGTG_01157 [Gaeumannomyces tritici R3-111a-1]EJT81173.1 hypothetical protein GGTG_01157 [Gaeumannomyces tritici R3-111a-1]
MLPPTSTGHHWGPNDGGSGDGDDAQSDNAGDQAAHPDGGTVEEGTGSFEEPGSSSYTWSGTVPGSAVGTSQYEADQAGTQHPAGAQYQIDIRHRIGTQHQAGVQNLNDSPAHLGADTSSPSAFWPSCGPSSALSSLVQDISEGQAVNANAQPMTPPALERHQCAFCGHKSPSNNKLVRHTRNKHWPYQYRCWCGDRFPGGRKDNYLRHFDKHGPRGEHCTIGTIRSSMVCGFCGGETYDAGAHRDHVQTCGNGSRGRPLGSNNGGK